MTDRPPEYLAEFLDALAGAGRDGTPLIFNADLVAAAAATIRRLIAPDGRDVTAPNRTTTGRAPLSSWRGQWEPQRSRTTLISKVTGVPTDVFAADSADGGRLRVIRANEPGIGLHLSISFVDEHGAPARYPTWDEIADARDQLLPADIGFVMHLPPRGEYVAVHPTTFHLHQHPAPSSGLPVVRRGSSLHVGSCARSNPDPALPADTPCTCPGSPRTVPCTPGMAARWCPNHGTCTCTGTGDDDDFSGPDCPIHGPLSTCDGGGYSTEEP